MKPTIVAKTTKANEMKLLKKQIDKDQSGFITFRLEYPDCVWHAYNLIAEKDQVRASAVRRIVNESSTGSTDSHRIRLNLTIRVDKIVYSAAPVSTTSDGAPVASTSGTTQSEATLHISGPVTQESPHVKLGAFHTLDLEVGREFTLIKGPGGWDSINMERIEESTMEDKGAEVGAVIATEGIAAICLITQHTTLVRQRIEVTVPRKRKGGGTASGAEKAMARFYQQIYDGITRHFDFDQLKAIIIASPGFTKEAVMQYIMDEAQKTGNKAILVSKPKFMLLHSASHHVHALTQLLATPEVAARLKDTKFAREGMLLNKFQRMMATDELRAWYGEDHVFKAAERGAIQTLLISDNLFKSNDFERRKKFVKLVEDVKLYGAEVLIFSSLHESGEQLNQLTGVAAILSYPLDIEIIEAEEAGEQIDQ